MIPVFRYIHGNCEAEVSDISVVELDLPKKSHVLLNPETLEINRVSVLVEGMYVYVN